MREFFFGDVDGVFDEVDEATREFGGFNFDEVTFDVAGVDGGSESLTIGTFSSVGSS